MFFRYLYFSKEKISDELTGANLSLILWIEAEAGLPSDTPSPLAGESISAPVSSAFLFTLYAVSKILAHLDALPIRPHNFLYFHGLSPVLHSLGIAQHIPLSSMQTAARRTDR